MPEGQTVFLWGPRQKGKTTFLKAAFPNAHRIDLLRTDEQMRYLRDPHLFREECRPLQRAYIDTYLKEEILEEGLARKLPVFSDLLFTAAIGDTEGNQATVVALKKSLAYWSWEAQRETELEASGAILPTVASRRRGCPSANSSPCREDNRLSVDLGRITLKQVRPAGRT